MSEDFVGAIKKGYTFAGPALQLGRALRGGKISSDLAISIPFAMLNRHGLVAGATGTGKTKTLQLMAGKLSDAGVPVFLADLKGDLSGLAKPGLANDKVLAPPSSACNLHCLWQSLRRVTAHLPRGPRAYARSARRPYRSRSHSARRAG